jgi:hypothetical protein
MRIVGLAVFSAALLAPAGTAFAQSGEPVPNSDRHVYDKNIHYFLPPTDGSGLITTWGSEPIGHLGIHVGALGDYSHRPMEYTDPQGKVHTVIYNQSAITGMGGFGLWDALNLSGAFVSVPNRSFNSRYQRVYKWGDSGTADARIALKYILTNRRTDGIGIAFLGEAGLGNGSKTEFISDEQFTATPRFIFDFGNEWFTYALNVGYKIYPDGIDGGLFDIPSGNEIIANTGLTFRFLWGLELVGDFALRKYEGESDWAHSYSEFFYALRSTWFVRNPLRITIGGSAGLSDGVGTPISRFYGGFNFMFREIGLP